MQLAETVGHAQQPGAGGVRIGTTEEVVERGRVGDVLEHEDAVIDLGVQHGLVDKSGAWYSYKGDRIGQGRDNVREFIKQNPAMAQELDSALRDILLPRRGAAEEAEDAKATEEAEA